MSNAEEQETREERRLGNRDNWGERHQVDTWKVETLWKWVKSVSTVTVWQFLFDWKIGAISTISSMCLMHRLNSNERNRDKPNCWNNIIETVYVRQCVNFTLYNCFAEFIKKTEATFFSQLLLNANYKWTIHTLIEVILIEWYTHFYDWLINY